MDPRSALHEGAAEVSSGSSCESCHGDAHKWETPRTDHFFFGKTDRQLCAIWSEAVASMGHPQFRDHLDHDELIGLAFKGLIGGAREPGAGTPPAPPADPPSLKHAEFVALAKAWMDTGGAACDVTGTITQEERIDTTEVQTSPGQTDRFEEKATRTVIISLQPNGTYSATITVNGTITNTSVIQSQNAAGLPCTITMETVNTFSGQTTGPAAVRMKDTVLFITTAQASDRQTDYRIDVTLPPERTRRIDTNRLEDGCGTIVRPSPPETIVTDWSAHRFTIEGHLEDRRQRNRVGGCNKFVKSSDVGRDLGVNDAPCFRFANVGNDDEPWLMQHEGASSFTDGREIPIQVTTTWNIVYRPR